MAKTPEQDSVFLREVDEAVRADQFDTFVRKYGALVIGVVVLVLGGFGGWLWYQNHQAEQAGEKGIVLVQALDRLNSQDPKAASDMLDGLKDSDNAAYQATARFTRANVVLDSGDKKRAVALFGAIADDGDMPEAYRNLALLRKTEIEFDTLKPDTVIARLKPLTDPESPWFGTASEMTAIAYLQKGDRKTAGRIYAEIAARDDVQPSLVSRSVQMAGMLGEDAVADSNLDDTKPGGVNAPLTDGAPATKQPTG